MAKNMAPKPKTVDVAFGHIDCESMDEQNGFSCAFDTVKPENDVIFDTPNNISRIVVPGSLIKLLRLDTAHKSRLLALDIKDAACKVTYGDDEDDPKSVVCSKQK